MLPPDLISFSSSRSNSPTRHYVTGTSSSQDIVLSLILKTLSLSWRQISSVASMASAFLYLQPSSSMVPGEKGFAGFNDGEPYFAMSTLLLPWRGGKTVRFATKYLLSVDTAQVSTLDLRTCELVVSCLYFPSIHKFSSSRHLDQPYPHLTHPPCTLILLYLVSSSYVPSQRPQMFQIPPHLLSSPGEFLTLGNNLLTHVPPSRTSASDFERLQIRNLFRGDFQVLIVEFLQDVALKLPDNVSNGR